MARINIPKPLQIEVYYRDAWHCRYCLDPVFFGPYLKLIDQLSPNHSYYHPNGKTGEMLPLFQWKFASADHFDPVARGGTNEVDNLVTACWKCNLDKRDSESVTWTLSDISDNVRNMKWDGFASLYLKHSEAERIWTKLIEPYDA